jgi:WD40 repeat protein/tRNA A-37 threonylcarbamoyl transferase component Bud32
MPRTRCLTSAELAAFHLGDLPETDLLALGEHLEQCPRCEEAARALDGLSDPTLAAYRHSATSGLLPAVNGLPERVGDYEILGEVGRGGMGVVYKARHVQLHRVVALKMLLASYFADRDQRLRFRIEAEAVARLQHPHIVQLFEIGEHEMDPGSPCPYFTLEFVEGGSLAARLAERPPPPRQAAAWLEPLARAVHYAHQQGIIHRDLKPANILLTSDGQPKICDFGVAKLLGGSDLKTLSGMLIGTAEYMAPEQAEGQTAADRATDVYALGTILYELLTFRPPFKGMSALDTLNQIRTVQPVPPRHLQPHVARDLETICLKCLEKEPRKRYATSEALAEDLRRFLAGAPISARPVNWWHRTVKWCHRRPAQAALAATLLVVVLVGFAGVTWQMFRAEAAKEIALQEKEAARWYAYRANIAAAASALQLTNISSARSYLDAAPEQYRNWEWHHFVSQLDPPHAVLRGHDAAVVSVAFSPNSTRLASASDDRTVRVWDCVTGTTVAVLRGHAGRVFQVSYSPDGKHLTSYSEDGTVYVWDMTNHQLSATLHGRFQWPCCLAPSGKELVSSGKDGTLSIWDTASGKVRAAWKGHSAAVTAVVFSPDGTRVLSSGHYPDNSVRLWDATMGRSLAVMAGHRNHVGYVAFSPDGSRIVSASRDQTARVWDAATGQALATLRGHQDQVLKAAFCPKGAYVVTVSRGRTVRLWDAKTGESLAVLGGHQDAVHGVAFSPDGNRIASASEDKTVRLWDAGLAERNGVLRGHTSYVYAVAFSPNGTEVASAAWDGTVRLWDATTGQQTGLLDHQKGIVTSVAFHPDGRHLVTIVRDHRVCLWDLAIRKLRYTWQAFPVPYQDPHAVFDPRGRFVAAAAGKASALLWDVASGQSVAVFGAQQGSSCDVAFRPDGGQLASAERDGTVRLWDVPTGEPRGVLGGHTGEVQAVCYNWDGTLIASAGLDLSVRLWDAKTQEPLLPVLRHASQVYNVAFSPDGTRLAAACRDSTIRLWDVTTHEEVAELRGHTDYAHAIAFSPDGSRLVSGSGDYTVRIWDTLSPQVPPRIRKAN